MENREEATLKALKLAANFKPLLHDLKTGMTDKISRNVATYTKLVATLPVKRKQKAYEDMTIPEIIAANKGDRCIAEGTFESTYKACVSIYLVGLTSIIKIKASHH